MTNAQAYTIISLRTYWRTTLYEMPAEHHHSPGIVFASCERWDDHAQEYISPLIRIHPDGRREAITDPLNEQHYRADMRKDGRRI